jgi:hypothetical protein
LPPELSADYGILFSPVILIRSYNLGGGGEPLAAPAVAGVEAKGAVWTAPELWAEVAYRRFRSGGELRQASFKGLREE